MVRIGEDVTERLDIVPAQFRVADTTLQRAPDPGAERGMSAQQLLEHGDGPQTGARLQHRDDLRFEEPIQHFAASRSLGR